MNRKYLKEEELPWEERRRRATIRNTIQFLEAEVEQRWAQIAQAVQHNGLSNGKLHAFEEKSHMDTIGLLVAINRLKLEIPPCVEMTEDLQLVQQPCCP
jgi:hypothetical protein